MTRITLSTVIDAPRADVWNTMLGPETYKIWTAPFMEGSYYEGTIEKGNRIRFLSPGGEGMISEIVELSPHEYISFKHLGIVKDGVIDTESDMARSMTPAFENYLFKDAGPGTEVYVEFDISAEYEGMMRETWPRALAVLKEICESPAK